MELQVVAHCLLNPETRLKGLRPPKFDLKSPLIQLLCPEAGYLGLDRWAVTKNQIDVPAYRRYCRDVFVHQADLIGQFARKDFDIKIVGVADSPNCGIRTTTAGYHGGKVWSEAHQHVPGMGVFMEEISKELKKRGINFQCVEANRKTIEP
ncbi:MAG: hypothetical protein ACXQT4_06345 [Methanotrichaceae archaeon]